LPKTNREIMKQALRELLENSNACTARLTLELGVFGSTTEVTRNQCRCLR
jgi:hypothetical protein